MSNLTVENFTRSKVIEAISDFTHKQKVIFAVYCAELVIGFYENKSDSKAPRLEIESAKEWIESPTEENKQKCKGAADAAAYAADAAKNEIRQEIIDKISEIKGESIESIELSIQAKVLSEKVSPTSFLLLSEQSHNDLLNIKASAESIKKSDCEIAKALTREVFKELSDELDNKEGE